MAILERTVSCALFLEYVSLIDAADDFAHGIAGIAAADAGELGFVDVDGVVDVLPAWAVE